ncbi:MAG: YHYH protein [Verrucomicrobiota bacterium]
MLVLNALHSVTAPRLAFLALCLLDSSVRADPQLSSWLTAGSTKYARIYASADARTAGTSITTWTGQNSATYAGVHEINYSPAWVYIRNSGLAPYIMGPWKNPNLPKNTGTAAGAYRFPRTPVVSTSKTLTGMGSIGFLVDGVSIYNTADGFSYSFVNSKDASPNAGIGPGDGIWNRDAWPNESGSFDYALNHPQPSGEYHAHATARGVRYLVGDNVLYNETTKQYSEDPSTTVFKHSPIIGWINDGLPLYGPYGYSDPNDASSPVRRMISGYVLRNGANGTINLTSVGRISLPKWAQDAQKITSALNANQYGPNVSITYEMGHFSEDYDYLGDLGYTQGITSTANGYSILFDLNKYNARWCKTPEFPDGTWAYFTTITSSGTPWYPYNVGRWYYGSPTGGASTTTAESNLTQYYKGSTSTIETWSGTPVTISPTTVTLSWNSVEGGTYKVSSSSDLTTWTDLTGTVSSAGNSATKTEPVNTTTTPKKFYKLTRTGITPYDSVGY